MTSTYATIALGCASGVVAALGIWTEYRRRPTCGTAILGVIAVGQIAGYGYLVWALHVPVPDC